MIYAGDAERACAYLVERVRRAAGSRWSQGAHAPALDERAAELGAAVSIVANRRLWRVPRHVSLGLIAWARGARDVELLTTVPSPAYVLSLQAAGRRCVSLLPDGGKEDGLEFALHDLCHLEKFVEPAHHDEQKGFFRCLARAMETPSWRAFDARYDDAWLRDVEHVAADMNGSAIFLFAALKMKLKMAVRRELSRRLGTPPPVGGPLAPEELAAFEAAVSELLDVLDLSGDVRAAAHAVSTKRDAKELAVRLQRWFAARGREIAAPDLAGRAVCSPS